MAAMYRVPVVLASEPGMATKSVKSFLRQLPTMRVVGEEVSVRDAMSRANKLHAHVVVLTGKLGKSDVVKLWKQGAFDFDDED